jgi:hypothetical protein
LGKAYLADGSQRADEKQKGEVQEEKLDSWRAGGGKAARLWQSDLKTGKQWPTTPLNAGHRRDFYRLTDPDKDPVMIEKKLSEIEGTIAPILKRLDSERRMSDADELGSLIVFMAIQWIRVPAFRPTVLGVTESLMQERMANALSTPVAWSQVLREARHTRRQPWKRLSEDARVYRVGRLLLQCWQRLVRKDGIYRGNRREVLPGKEVLGDWCQRGRRLYCLR